MSKINLERRLKKGVEYNQSLREVSEGINHSLERDHDFVLFA